MNFTEEKGYPLSCDACHAAVGCQLEAGSEECKIRYANKPKQTNADKIRAMDDAELAELISEHYKCYTCPCYAKCTKKGCIESVVDWLKQESEVGR